MAVGFFRSRGEPLVLSKTVDTVFVTRLITRIALLPVSATYIFPVAASTDISLGELKVATLHGPLFDPFFQETPATVVTIVTGPVALRENVILRIK